jgi:hypothetical protein
MEPPEPSSSASPAEQLESTSAMSAQHVIVGFI